MNRLIPSLALLVVLAFTATTASAQGKAESDIFTRSDGSFKASGQVGAPATLPQTLRGASSVVSITQNASQAVETGSGVACPTPPNAVFRRIDLSGFGLGATGIAVTSVDIGIEAVGGAQTSTINLYRLTGDFVRANLTLVATASAPISAADNLTLRNVPITGTFARTDVLVVEWAYPLAQTFFGGNNAGASGPTYVQATGCNVAEPTDISTLGSFPSQWVVNVNGNTDPIVGPSLQIAPGSLNFDRIAVGSSSTAQTVTLTNNGTAGVIIASITGSGAPFTINQTGIDLTLNPGQSTTFTATFSPTATGAAAGTITVTSNAPGSPATITLAGEGFAPPPNDNIANAIVIPGDGTYTGTNAEATQEPDPGDAASCVGSATNSVWWTFTPGSTGTLTVSTDGSSFDTVLTFHQPGTTEIACDDDGGAGFQSLLTNIPVTGGQPVLIRIAGFGASSGDITFTLDGPAAAGPGLTITPAAVAFPATTVGQTRTQVVTITNTGTTTVNLASVAYTGSPSITASAVAPGPVAAGASRTTTLTFAPTAAGASAGTLTITSDAPGSPATVAITGTGTTGSTTYPSTDTPLPITDNNPTGITSTIVVPAGAPVVADLDVNLDITHTWVGDFVITLTKGGAVATLADRPGTATTPPGLGCGANNMVVVVDDTGGAGSLETACTGVATGAEAYTSGGRYAPNSPLSVFNGSSAAGTYTLFISDNAGQDTGTLNAWALVVQGGVASDGGAGAAASRLVVAPNPLAGQGQIDLTVGTAQDVRVVLFDALGREVRVLLDRPMAAGQQAYIGFTTAGLPAGVYVVRASGTDVNLTQRVTVVR